MFSVTLTYCWLQAGALCFWSLTFLNGKVSAKLKLYSGGQHTDVTTQKLYSSMSILEYHMYKILNKKNLF